MILSTPTRHSHLALPGKEIQNSSGRFPASVTPHHHRGCSSSSTNLPPLHPPIPHTHNQELLLLIHEHLKASGLHGAAAALAKEAALARVTASMAAAAQNTPMPLPPPPQAAQHQHQPLNPLPVAGGARMAAAAPHHQPSGLHHPRPLAPAATGNHHQSATSPSPAISAGGDAWPFIVGPSRTGTPLGLAGRAGGGATTPSFPAPASSKMKKVLGVSPSLQLGPTAAATSAPWGAMGGSAAAAAATPGGAATTPQPQPQPQSEAIVAALPQLTLSPAMCAAAATKDAATTPRLAAGGGTGKRAREVPSAVAAPAAASAPASAPTPAAAGAGDKRKAASQLQRPLSEATAPPLRQAVPAATATATPFSGPAATPATGVSAVDAAASAHSQLSRSSSPFSPSELQGATFHTPAATTAAAATAGVAAFNDRALPAPRTLSPFVHLPHRLEAATPVAPAAAAPPTTTVNALLLDLPSSRPAGQAGGQAGGGGGGGLFRRAGSSGPEGLPTGLSSLSTLLARAGSGGGPATAASLVSAPLPPDGGGGPALMASEPMELPRFLEAACREVRTLAGPPANSKLHSIVMAYLKHQHRQACMQSAAPTSTLPPIPLSKPYALPQVGRGGGLRRRWGHLNATGQGSAYCPR